MSEKEHLDNIVLDTNLFHPITEDWFKALNNVINQEKTNDDEKQSARISNIVRKMMINKKMNNEDFESILKIFKEIYSKEYRHYYSNISALIYSERRNSANPKEALDILGENNRKLHKYINQEMDHDDKSKLDIEILKKCNKFYDHIDLEVVRLKEYDRQIEKSVNDINVTIKDFNNEAQKKTEMIQEEARKMKSEYISILGIFASIVLAFVGGLTYSTSVLSNLHHGSIYRVSIVSSIVGMVFLLIVWLLMDFVKSINGNDRRRLRYLIIPEVVLISIIVLSTIGYQFDWFKGEENLTRTIYEEAVQSESKSYKKNDENKKSKNHDKTDSENKSDEKSIEVK